VQAKSVHTICLDPYRAGAELADGLAQIEPEVVFLFPTIHYEGSPELSEAIYDVLGPDLLLIGATGAGFYERERVAIAGASALGISSGGALRWALCSAEGVGGEAAQATEHCLDKLRTQLGEPALVFLVADFRLDATSIADALHRKAAAPVVGGYAGDDNYLIERCFTYANREVLREGLAMLGVAGDLSFAIRVAQPLRPVGEVGTITDGSGTTIRAIDGVPAMEFLERATGMPMLSADQGTVALDVSYPDEPGLRHLRSMLLVSDNGQGSVRLFGKIREGQRVQVCLAQPNDLVREVQDLASSLPDLDFSPRAALVMSCAGRKQVLGRRIEHEVRAITNAGPPGLSLAGLSTFGEIGPVAFETDGSLPQFHNMAYALLLLGERRR
jgi:hypothetical protein